MTLTLKVAPLLKAAHYGSDMGFPTYDYHKRIDPISYYTDTKFVQRYRLTKRVVRLLIEKFTKTQLKPILRGENAVTHRLRVGVTVQRRIY